MTAELYMYLFVLAALLIAASIALFIGAAIVWLCKPSPGDLPYRPVQPLPRTGRRPHDPVEQVRDLVTSRDRLRTFFMDRD